MSAPKGGTRRRRSSAQPSSPQIAVAPGWWARQHDPESSLYLPTPLAERNRLEVGWSLLSTLDGGGAASLDRRGAVQLPGASWLLDWWYNHDGNWMRASTAAGVRQVRTDGLPLAETRVRVGPNELVVRHGAAPRKGAAGAAWVTIEVEVDGPDPIGLALVATPWTMLEQGRIDRVQVSNGVLSVDGRPALVAERPPRAAHVVERADDLIELLAIVEEPHSSAGQAALDAVSSVPMMQSPGGTAGAALVWPMAHRSTLRLGLPIGPIEDGSGLDPGELARVADSAAVANGWALHLGGEPAIELPDPTLTAMARAARAQLLAASDGAWLTGGDPASTALAAAALARAGHPGAVRRVVSEVARDTDDDPVGLLAVLEACVGVGLGYSATDVAEAPEELLAHLARALHVCLRRLRRSGVKWWPQATRADLSRLVDSAAAMADRWAQDGVADNARAISALLADAPAPKPPEPAAPEPAAPKPEPAASNTEPEAPNTEVGSAEDAGGASGLPTSGESAPDEAAPADQQEQSDELQPRWVRRVPGADLDLPATLARARSDIAQGDPVGTVTVVAVAALLDRLKCWPDVVHPTRPLGVGDDGASVATMAQLLMASLDLAAPIGAGAVTAFPAFPPDWWGRPAQFSGLDVGGGTVSCALRWHGSRPALIWELNGATGDASWPEGRPLTAPALDPEFATTEREGETLLAMPPGAAEFLAARAADAVASSEPEGASASADAAPAGANDSAGSNDSAAAAESAGGVTMNVGIPTRRRSDGG